MRIYIQPYNVGSRSANALREALSAHYQREIFLIRPEKMFATIAPDRALINWGSGAHPRFPGYRSILNTSTEVSNAGNKLSSFRAFQAAGVTTPEWTTDAMVVESWLARGETVFARHTLRGHSGQGIQINGHEEHLTEEEEEQFYNAHLFVKYKKKKHEFRVHVFNDRIIDIQQKKRRHDLPPDHVGHRAKIRNLATGWVFCREDLDLDSDGQRARMYGLAINAINALGLLFGAVDIIYNQREDQFYVLEVNTAPGLEGTTLQSYKDAIVEYIDNL